LAGKSAQKINSKSKKTLTGFLILLSKKYFNRLCDIGEASKVLLMAWDLPIDVCNQHLVPAGTDTRGVLSCYLVTNF